MLSDVRTSRVERQAVPARNAPSGIAQQLRKTSEQVSQPEPMNLDDFIIPESVATPVGMANTPTPSLDAGKKPEERSSHSLASAIPIKSRKEPGKHFVPQSVPVSQHHQRVQDEFGYVTRHHRKTSIDERRVSISLSSTLGIFGFLPSPCYPCPPFSLPFCLYLTRLSLPLFVASNSRRLLAQAALRSGLSENPS